MAENLAPYACDKCQSRKVACSRERLACLRCKDEDLVCTYSRTGVIRRNRKRKHETLGGDESRSSTLSLDHGPSRADNSMQSHLVDDIEETRDQLRRHSTSQHNSLGALSSLSEACAAIWHDASEFDKTGTKFFLFKDHAVSWADAET
ncbi:MAG: hypothetical protein M1820_005387 [Bogoriella megaspora]|nr:MAG: hypothetical protein M1820_005387 [Bogoriella megaspora]